MKKLLCLALCAALLLMFSACGNEEPTSSAITWRTDVSVETLAAAVKGVSSASDLFEALTPELIVIETDLVAARCTEYALFRTGNTLDEFGIFRSAEEASAAAVEQMMKAYIQRRNDEWTGMYMVEEYPKLEKAQVKRDGCYVLLVILSEEERAAAIEAFDNALKG